MIVYRELSSLVNDIGFSAKALYTACNSISKHYRSVKIPKKNGEYRELHVPDEFLKAIQRSIVNKLLIYEDISPFASAYRFGGGALKNAEPHLGGNILLKLDIRHFFDSIIYSSVKEKVFPAERYSESNRILLSILCVYKDSLPQGAPSSPAVSNIIMRDFDNTVGKWCLSQNITYTRYCDDMTFSGDFEPSDVISFVKSELLKMGFFLNDKKTVKACNGRKKMVTGVIVNDKLNAPIEYRKKLRQELYYCKKFGIDSHMARIGITLSREEYLRKLLGRVSYVLSINPENREMKDYKAWLTEALRQCR